MQEARGRVFILAYCGQGALTLEYEEENNEFYRFTVYRRVLNA